MIYDRKYLVGNTIGNNELADKIISLSPNVELVPYSFFPFAETIGLSFHTKKRLQDEDIWKQGIDHIKTELNLLEASDKKLLLQDKMNYMMSWDISATNYIATFVNRTYLDLVGLISEEYDLEPFNENFSLKKFDEEVNNQLADYEIIYFNDTDNIVLKVIEVLREKYDEFAKVPQDEMWDRVYNEPWFIIKTLLQDTVIDPWKLLGKNYPVIFTKLLSEIDIFMHKAEQKIAKSQTSDGMIIFDLAMLHLHSNGEACDIYTHTCSQLGITPNLDKFIDYHNESKLDIIHGIGTEPLPLKYKDIIESIAKYLLKVDGVFLDTTLTSLRWNILCQVAFIAAIKKYNESISLEFSDCETIHDLLSKINIS